MAVEGNIMADLLTELPARGEDEEIEFKSSFGRETIKTLVTFANAKGGRVLVGINDVQEVIGVSITDGSLPQWLNQIKSVTSPAIVLDVEVLRHDDKQVVLFQVPSYPVKPVSMKGKYFIRRFASNHLMNLEEIVNEHLKTINMSWDFALHPNHTVRDNSLDKVNNFVEMANTLRDFPITDDPLTVLGKDLFRPDRVLQSRHPAAGAAPAGHPVRYHSLVHQKQADSRRLQGSWNHREIRFRHQTGAPAHAGCRGRGADV